MALSDDESAATSARRLRSLRSLWDPTYVDESWIGTPVRLIPRMKEWIAAELPGTKLAITEYSWGNDDGLSSALAQAEVLGIFAREGVDIATRWVAPAAGSLVEDAFRLWLDYDGAGARVAGASVRATSSAPDAVSGYAVEAPGGAAPRRPREPRHRAAARHRRAVGRRDADRPALRLRRHDAPRRARHGRASAAAR